MCVIYPRCVISHYQTGIIMQVYVCMYQVALMNHIVLYTFFLSEFICVYAFAFVVIWFDVHYYIICLHSRSPQRLLLDLLCSERSYVQSLRRSLEVRGSCPASLALRGSLEQLLNFHTHFLRYLQNCVSHPFTVSYCFLQHVSLF